MKRVKQRHIHLRKQIYSVLELPIDEFGELFRYTVVGDCEALVKCFDTLYAFSDSEAVFEVRGKLFVVCGSDLCLSRLSSHSVFITGEITSMGYK